MRNCFFALLFFASAVAGQGQENRKADIFNVKDMPENN